MGVVSTCWYCGSTHSSVQSPPDCSSGSNTYWIKAGNEADEEGCYDNGMKENKNQIHCVLTCITNNTMREVSASVRIHLYPEAVALVKH